MAKPLQLHSRTRLVVRAKKGNGKPEDKNDEYIEALKKGGIDQKTARNVLDKWKEAGAEGDPNELRKLFLKQSLVPITATLVQLLFDAGAAYSIFMTAGFLALGGDFFWPGPSGVSTRFLGNLLCLWGAV